VLRGIIKTNRKELTGQSTKSCMISIICTPISDITQVLESRKMRRVWYVTYGLEWEKEAKDTSQKTRCSWDYIKMCLKKQNSYGYECGPVASFVSMVIKVCLEWKTLK